MAMFRLFTALSMVARHRTVVVGESQDMNRRDGKHLLNLIVSLLRTSGNSRKTKPKNFVPTLLKLCAFTTSAPPNQRATLLLPGKRSFS